MAKKYPFRVELKAKLEMFAQNRLAMWQAIDNESEDKCDRCAVKVCPWYIEGEEKIIDEIINLFLERFTLGMIANQKKVVEILQDKGEETNGKH